MLAKDIMTKQVICIQETAKIFELTKLLTEKMISGVPVCNKRGKVVGIVTERDLIGLKKGELVKDIMTPAVIGVRPDQTIEEVAATLHSNKVKRVPVFEAGNIIGIISRSDIIFAIAKRMSNSIQSVI